MMLSQVMHPAGFHLRGPLGQIVVDIGGVCARVTSSGVALEVELLVLRAAAVLIAAGKNDSLLGFELRSVADALTAFAAQGAKFPDATAADKVWTADDRRRICEGVALADRMGRELSDSAVTAAYDRLIELASQLQAATQIPPASKPTGANASFVLAAVLGVAVGAGVVFTLTRYAA